MSDNKRNLSLGLLLINLFNSFLLHEWITAYICFYHYLYWSNRVGRFNSSFCTRRSRFCPVPSWHHLLFESDSIVVSYLSSTGFLREDVISFGKPNQLWFSFLLVYCCIIDNLRDTNRKFLNKVRYVSQQRGHIWFFHLGFP